MWMPTMFDRDFFADFFDDPFFNDKEMRKLEKKQAASQAMMEAAKQTGAEKLVIAGGVSANRLLRARLQEECGKRGWKFYRPELCYCGDNAAMVASQGYCEFLQGNLAGMELNACANMAVDTLK